MKNSPLDFEAIRQRYQKALLVWLKATETGDGLPQMRAILAAVALAHPEEISPFWRDAESLIQGLIDGKLQPDLVVRKLAGRIDFQLRQLAAGQALPDPSLWADLRQNLERLKPPPQPTPAPLAPLAETLAKTAAILPFVTTPAAPRFSAEASEAWDAASQTLQRAWSDRYQVGWAPFRAAIFSLCGAALKLEEPQFLRLSEALASATDRIDDEDPQPPGHLVAAIAATLECMAERDFLEHTALYARLDLFSGRLEKATELETQAQLARRPPPPPVTEIRFPQPSPVPSETQPKSPIIDFMRSLHQKAADNGLAVSEPLRPLGDLPFEDLSTPEEGFPVDAIALASTHLEVRELPPSPTLVKLFEDDADEKIEDMRSALEVVPPEGKLLSRVARDLEQLADSLGLAGLAKQAHRLADMVDRMDAQTLDQDFVRADLLAIIQCMQDQVGAVAMGLPPHTSPKITELMDALVLKVPSIRQEPA